MMKGTVLILSTLLVATGCGGGDGGGVTDPAGSGTLRGEVTGPGGPVPGAAVAMTGGGSVETTSDGVYSFTGVEAGQKTVTVTPPGEFQLAPGENAAKTATVPSGGSVSVDWALRLGSSEPRTVEVELTANSFYFADVTVPVGSTISWINGTAITHTISPSDPGKAGTWEEVTISGEGTKFEHTFDSTGTYPYVCKLHAGMTGVVRVH